jgi:Ni/Co efflux regulator RcnB
MTFKFVLAAALAVVGVSPALASPAAAAPVSAPAPLAAAAAWEPQRTVVHERTVVRRGPGYGRHGYRNRVRTRRVCTNRWRHGERVRVCRTVRRYR